MHEQPHVLFIVDTFHQSLGGAEGALLRVTRLLPRDKYQCSVATFASARNLEEVRNQFSCPVYLLPLQHTYGWNALRVALQLRHLIRSQEVKIVHTFFATSDLWGGLVAKLSGCPILISSRRDMGILRTLKHRVAYRFMSSIYDQVHAVSDEVRNFSIAADGLDPDKVVTLHNGISVEEIDAAEPTSPHSLLPNAPSTSRVVVTVGNIRPVKGIDVLIRTAALVAREFPQVLFLVIGEPHGQQYFRELQSLAESLQVTRNVQFLGLRSDVFSILKMADIFCLLSRSEGLSNALLEAMACRLPCVATRVGGNGELVEDGRSGYVVPSEEPEAAADRVLKLLRDPDLAKQMGERGREVVASDFTAQNMVAHLVELYDNLLREHR